MPPSSMKSEDKVPILENGQHTCKKCARENFRAKCRGLFIEVAIHLICSLPLFATTLVPIEMVQAVCAPFVICITAIPYISFICSYGRYLTIFLIFRFFQILAIFFSHFTLICLYYDMELYKALARENRGGVLSFEEAANYIIRTDEFFTCFLFGLTFHIGLFFTGFMFRRTFLIRRAEERRRAACANEKMEKPDILTLLEGRTQNANRDDEYRIIIFGVNLGEIFTEKHKIFVEDIKKELRDPTLRRHNIL